MISSVCSVLADDLESDGPNALRYVPGKARSHHLEMMLSKEELEEEQRSVGSTQITGVTSSSLKSPPSPVSPLNPLYAVFTCVSVSSGFCLEVYRPL